VGQVTLRMEGNIAVITVASPGRLNAFTRAMRADIGRILAEIQGDPRSAAAVVTGAGDAFCSGQDLNEARKWDKTTPWVEEFESFARAILSFRKPLVAAVNGVAAGGGFQMALLCDSRIGHSEVSMGQPEVKRDLASITGTWLLRRSIGDLRAREIVLTGRLMDADELVRLGILDAIVHREKVLECALQKCRVLAANPPDSFARTKIWLYESISDEISSVFKDASRLHGQGFASGVSQAGAAGFLRLAGNLV
jgi:enoyl-CoA hydratase/carnithine racemase